MKNQIKPIRLEIKKSIILKWFIIFTHGLALTACITNALPFWIKNVLVIVVSLHAWMMWQRHIQVKFILKLLYAQNTGWEIEDKSGVHAIQIMASTVVTIYVIVLHYKFQSGEKQSILIFKDTLLTDEFRELTVALKLYGLN